MKVHVIEGYGISSNIYVIEAERPAVIDAGTLEDAEQSIARIRATGLKPEIMVLTHRHVDHIGGARRIAEAFGISEIYAGKGDADAIRNADDSAGARAFGLGVEAVDVIPISEGDSIDMGNHELEVMETPGHTIGSISLVERSSMALFSGDTVFADGGIGRWDLPTGEFGALMSSVERLSSMKPSSLCPGHGKAVIGGADRHLAMSQSSLIYYSSSSLSDSESF